MMHPRLRFPLALSVSILLSASSVSLGGRFGVELLQPDSLVGWDHGDPPPEGWTIVDGRLTGSATSTPLLSAWTFGGFELRFRWSVADEGALQLLLPNVPSGKGLRLTLCEGSDCGRLTDSDTELAPGRRIKSRKGKSHAAVVRRDGGKLGVTIDGRWLYEVDVDAGRRLGLGLAVTAGRGTIAEVRLEEPPGKPMFNGKDLAGWYTNGDITQWLVKGEQVVLSGRPRDYLRTEKEYANFTWSMELKMRRGGNSGLGIRTPHQGWPTADGMELQLLDSPYDAVIKDQPFMAVYGHVLPLGRADKSERWNRVVVKAEGYMITAWVNGRMVQQVNTFHHPELKHRFLRGWLGFQDHGAWIRARNVRLLEAPSGLGMSAWYRPRPPVAVTAVLDRLINPERLSVADGITSGVAFKTFSGQQKTEQVLAELTGPGAVVRIAQSGDEGLLAFYFDGQKEPRIECPAGELGAAVPPVGKDSNPLLTCLTYRKSLRIVLRNAAQGEYRFDYVTFPNNLPVETFVDRESGFPRGWLPAVTTILRWLKSGRYHQHDRLPRFGTENQTIKPGQTQPLAAVEGAGIVTSLKLMANKRVLENDDLWLEVTVDGEKRPAIAAPARYLFPALKRNYENYVLQDQGGPTLRLAMPFGNGITVSAANRGGRPIRNLGVSLSVRRAGAGVTQKEIAARMRLRGVFRPAENGNNELINQQGSGRWVGLVCQLPDEEPGGIASLLIDGRPVGGWSAETLEPFLGGAGDFRKHLSGREGVLCWRYLLLAPVSFQKSIVLTTGSDRVGDRLALFYLNK